MLTSLHGGLAHMICTPNARRTLMLALHIVLQTKGSTALCMSLYGIIDALKPQRKRALREFLKYLWTLQTHKGERRPPLNSVVLFLLLRSDMGVMRAAVSVLCGPICVAAVAAAVLCDADSVAVAAVGAVGAVGAGGSAAPSDVALVGDCCCCCLFICMWVRARACVRVRVYACECVRVGVCTCVRVCVVRCGVLQALITSPSVAQR
jgi:hypothetical protein